LFAQLPATITAHIEYAIQLYRKGAVPLSESYGTPSSPEDPRPMIKWLVEVGPQFLCSAHDNFFLRMAHHELFPDISTSRNILRPTRAQIETDVARDFGVRDMKAPVPRKGYDPEANYDHRNPAQRHHVLCRLIDIGLIKSLRLTPDHPSPVRVDLAQFRRPTDSVLVNLLCPSGSMSAPASVRPPRKRQN
jgi:hypothetical protein